MPRLEQSARGRSPWPDVRWFGEVASARTLTISRAITSEFGTTITPSASSDTLIAPVCNDPPSTAIRSPWRVFFRRATIPCSCSMLGCVHAKCRSMVRTEEPACVCINDRGRWSCSKYELPGWAAWVSGLLIVGCSSNSPEVADTAAASRPSADSSSNVRSSDPAPTFDFVPLEEPVVPASAGDAVLGSVFTDLAVEAGVQHTYLNGASPKARDGGRGHWGRMRLAGLRPGRPDGSVSESGGRTGRSS